MLVELKEQGKKRQRRGTYPALYIKENIRSSQQMIIRRT